MNMVSPGSPWWTITDPLAAEAGARRRERAWRMLSGRVKKIATRSRIWKRLRSSSGEPEVTRSLSLTPLGIIGLGSQLPLPLRGQAWAQSELEAVGRLSRCRSRGVAWPNTRPCQGRERRFESGRDRHFERSRRGGRVVEGGGLENRYGSLAHREFESLPLRSTPSRIVRTNRQLCRTSARFVWTIREVPWRDRPAPSHGRS